MNLLLRFRRPQTIVEVGAWQGDDALIDVCRRRGHRLYLFEPNPKWVAVLRDNTAGAPNIRVIPAAVSDTDGQATLYLANHDDCSSLQQFATDANRNWAHPWHGYATFEMVGEVAADVVRLDTFMNREGIARIDFLEIDAQGEDLRVVQSLGERIADVRKIQIEVNLHDSPLYARSFTLDDALAFFEGHGFDRHVWWTQSVGREANIVFRNRRWYPRTLFTRAAAKIEQVWLRLYFASLKVPRVLAVTRSILLGRLKAAR